MNILRSALVLEIWVVGGLAFAGLVSSALLPAAPVAALTFWLLRWLAAGRLTARTAADAPLALLALMTPVTLWATAFPEITAPQVWRLWTGLALYYAVVNWATTSNRLRWLSGGLALSSLGLAFFALFSVEWITSKFRFVPAWIYERIPRLVADLVHANVMAGYLAILLPLSLAALLFIDRAIPPLARWVSLAASLAAVSMILVTQSRGGAMAAGVVFLLLPLLRWKRGWMITLGILVAAGGVLFLSGYTSVIELILYNDAIAGVEGRMEIWSRAIYMIQDFPFTGVGMGSYGPVADKLYPFFVAAPGTTPHAHNLLLQIAVDVGLPGLIAWLAAFLLVTQAAWQTYRQGRQHGELWLAGLGAALLCSQAALLVHGAVDAVTWGMVRPAPLVWALWGLAMAARAVAQSPAKGRGAI